MRILAINGSPKGERSNTWQLTQAFLDGVTERLGADNVELRTVIVRDLEIQPYRLLCVGRRHHLELPAVLLWGTWPAQEPY